MSLTSLPNELLYIIAENLDATNLSRFVRTNHRIYHLTKSLLSSLLTVGEIQRRFARALYRNYDRCVRSLIAKGADVNSRWESGNSTWRQSFYITALKAAVQAGSRQVAAVLIENGASKHECVEYWSLVMLAVKKGNYLLTKLLLENGYTPNALEENIGGPLFLAVEKRRRGLVELLLYFGADPNRTNLIGLVPVDIPYGWRQHALSLRRERERKMQKRLQGFEVVFSDDERYYWPQREEEEMAYEISESNLGDNLPVDPNEVPSLLRLLLIAMKHWETDAFRDYLRGRVMAEAQLQEAWEAEHGVETALSDSESEY